MFYRPLLSFLIACVGLSALAAEPGGQAPGVYGGGKPVGIGEITRGRFRSELEALAPAAQAQALGWLSRLTFHENDLADLHADSSGGIYFSCSFRGSKAAVKPVQPLIAPGVAGASVPIANPPSYHSKPGSPNRFYLDFNGGVITNTQWNTSRSITTFDYGPFDTDSDPSTFSDSEQAAIRLIWERVSEDYAPFDIDITTDPATETNPNVRTGRVLITTAADKFGNSVITENWGGVAYVNVFGTNSFASYSPAFVFYDRLSSAEDYIAEACSHEMGHNLGLSHDGTAADAYYSTHGTGLVSWGPIMGAAYDANVSQFSKGEYTGANQPQDDLGIISGKITYRTDDYGNTDLTATALTGSTITASGIIEQNTDVDVLQILSGAGAVTFRVSPFQSSSDTMGGNLDVKLTLADQNGVVIATANPASATIATLSTTVTGGTYYLRIANDSEGSPLGTPSTGYTTYGSIGQWSLTGTVQSINTASIVATDGTASEPGADTGTFTVTLATPAVGNITLPITIGGSAIAGSDYTALPSSITVLSGQTTATLTVTALDDPAVELPETVIVTLVSATNVGVVTPSSATVSIIDDDTPTASILATDPLATESPGDNGLIEVSITRATTYDMRIVFSVGGSAQNGVDYASIGINAVIPAGATRARIVVTPSDDLNVEGEETVQLTLAPGAGYVLGGVNNTATVAIADNTPTSSDSSSNCGIGGIGLILALSLASFVARRRQHV